MQNFGFCRFCLLIIPACVCFHKMAYISKYPPIKFQKARLIMGLGGRCFVFDTSTPSLLLLPRQSLSPYHHRCIIVIYTLSYEPLLRWLYFSLFTPFFSDFFFLHNDTYFSFTFLFFFLQCVNLSHFENLFIEVSSKMTLINFFFFSLPRTSAGSFLRGREIIFFGKHTGTLVL